MKPDGTACSDQSACTSNDKCHAGACLGIETTCDALDVCHDPGTCDPSTGQCSNPGKQNGAPCSDGNACTQSDSCLAGICVSGSAITCTGQDECHDPGTCNASTGQCSHPAKADGTACSLGSCVAGQCGSPTDAGLDAPESDAAQDAPQESPVDAPQEAHPDSALDSGKDGGLDAALDAAPHDGAKDSKPDGKEASWDAAHDGAPSDARHDGSDATAAAADSAPTTDGGCGCEVIGVQSRAAPWVALGAMALLTLRRRKRSSTAAVNIT